MLNNWKDMVRDEEGEMENLEDWDGVYRDVDGTPIFNCNDCMDLGCDKCPQSEEGKKAQEVLAMHDDIPNFEVKK